MSTQTFDRTRLRIARELSTWSQAQLAAKADVTPAAISQFESGAARPKPETAVLLSELLNVPVEFFYAPTTDSHEGFFRSLRRTSVADRRRARAIGHVAHDLVLHAADAQMFSAHGVPQIPASGLDAGISEIEQIAARVRSAWSLPAGPVVDVVELLEKHGVGVIRLPLGNTDVDAFSLPFTGHPVVVLGTDKNDRARSRFDCAHELGHLVLHGEQIWGVKEVETQAHQFAAAFLMPADEIYDELPSRVDWQAFFQLKRRWEVSLAALLMRAKTLGKMDDRSYLTAVKTISARGWRRVEPIPLGQPEHPSELLNFLDSSASADARALLPNDLVEKIYSASTA